MNSLKKASGTFKGLIGECMYRIENPRIILTHFQPKELAIRQLREIYDDKQIAFIFANWDTIDAIATNETTVYEIKTRCGDYGKYKLRVMANCHNTLKKAARIGITPKLIKVIFEEDWLFRVEETDYLDEHLEVIVPKKYNKPYQKVFLH
jgi:hypothetical protein